jgi:hypothetical protein
MVNGIVDEDEEEEAEEEEDVIEEEDKEETGKLTLKPSKHEANDVPTAWKPRATMSLPPEPRKSGKFKTERVAADQ